MASKGKKVTDRKDDQTDNGERLTEVQRERIRKSIELMAKTRPVNIDELLPYQRNQKDHPEEQIRNLANSLRRFGWRQPVVIDERNVIVIGHGRVLGAKLLGLTEAPVVSAADLTEDEIRELRIIDNKLNESAWNKYLEEDVQELSFEGFEGLDFEGLEISDGTDDEQLPEEDDFDDTVPAEVKTQRGDIYQLGRHRLMCGDSTSREEIEALLDGNEIQLALTDPPYGINAVKVSSGGGTGTIGTGNWPTGTRQSGRRRGAQIQTGTIGGGEERPNSTERDNRRSKADNLPDGSGGVVFNSGKEQNHTRSCGSSAYVSACEGRRKHRHGKGILGSVERTGETSDHFRWELLHRFPGTKPVLGGVG